MNIHKNARLTPLRREEMALSVIEGRMSRAAAARVYGVSLKIVTRWVERYTAEGRAGMVDRSSRPHRLREPTEEACIARIIALRRERWTGQHIAQQIGVSAATVSRVLKRAGLSRLRDIEPTEPVRHYERARPGEMIHLDIKKLGKFNQVGHRITGDRSGQSIQRQNDTAPGWEYVHVCVDDHSRLSFTQIHPDEKALSAIAHLRAAVAWYRSMGITVERVMTDNGSCYKSFAFKARLCRPRHPPHSHQTLHAKDQWKSRAVHPDRTPRVGVCPCLQHLRPTRRTPAHLDTHVQLAPAPWQPRLKTTNQSPHALPRQPVEAPHLVDALSLHQPRAQAAPA